MDVRSENNQQRRNIREEFIMGMVVKNNMSAVNTLNTLNKNQSALSKSLQKVSSGMKVNSAADDASGYAISERMRVQIRSLDQANQNTQNGSSMMKTAEGAVSSTVEILKTLKEKVISAANDDKTDDDRKQIQKELNQSIDQIDNNANVTYNGKTLVDGSKNVKTTATTTVLYTEALNTGTKISMALTALTDRNGNNLQIQSTDYVTVSFVKQGRTYTTTWKVGASTTLSSMAAATGYNGTASLAGSAFLTISASTSLLGTDGSSAQVVTADGGSAVFVTAKGSGVNSQISGFTISITTKDGKVNTSANAVLDSFTEGIRAVNSSEDNAITLHIGAKAGQAIKVGLTDMRSSALGLKGTDNEVLNVSTQKMANAAINVLDNALQKALEQQTTIGAIESRLEYTSTNLTTSSENVQASESTIRDADMAKEMTEYTKNNVLLQAAQSMLSQANQNSSAVLSLLQ
jgi:flagellin